MIPTQSTHTSRYLDAWYERRITITCMIITIPTRALSISAFDAMCGIVHHVFLGIERTRDRFAGLGECLHGIAHVLQRQIRKAHGRNVRYRPAHVLEHRCRVLGTWEHYHGLIRLDAVDQIGVMIGVIMAPIRIDDVVVPSNANTAFVAACSVSIT